MEICRLSFSIDKVSIYPSLVNAIQLALIPEQVRFAKGPSLGDREAIELVADLKKAVILILEALINFALAVSS